jgi:hypothetical protein
VKGRIVIEVRETEDEFGVEVNVTGELSVLEALGLMEIAKLQHLQSKHTQGPTLFQEQAPWPHTHN